MEFPGVPLEVKGSDVILHSTSSFLLEESRLLCVKNELKNPFVSTGENGNVILILFSR